MQHDCTARAGTPFAVTCGLVLLVRERERESITTKVNGQTSTPPCYMFLSISYPPLLPSKMSAVQVDCFLLFLLHFPLLIQFHCTFCTKGIFHLSPSLYKCKCQATPNLNEILMCFWVAFSFLILMTKATLHLAPWFLSISNHVSLPLTFFSFFFRC